MDSYVADAINGLRQAILDTYEEGRERSLALTNLEQSELWLTRAPMQAPVGTSSVEAEAKVKDMEAPQQPPPAGQDAE